MTRIHEQAWALPEVETVFDLVFRLDLDEEVEAHGVDVTCRYEPLETRRVTLHKNRPSHVDLRFLSGCTLRGELALVRHGGRGNLVFGVEADLRYAVNGTAPVQRFQGLVLRVDVFPPPIPPPVPPPVPVRPDPPGPEPRAIVSPAPAALFPYVYVRHWPKVSQEDLFYGFISPAAASPPAQGFVDDLVAATARGRAAAEAVALAFVDGAPPYDGQFVPGVASLGRPVARFAAAAARLRGPRPHDVPWVDALCAETARLLRREPPDYLQSPRYRAVIERVWDSYFALVVLLGYDQALLGELGLTLWFANAAAKALEPGRHGGYEVVPGLDPARRALLAEASVLLPAALFPLPPATPEAAGLPAPADRGWVEPYAIGDLQMVRQRLVRYAAGAIARIENVMRGERREVSRRQGSEQVDVRSTRYDERQDLGVEETDGRSGSAGDGTRALGGKVVSDAYQDFTTSYGPPTQATLNGTRTRTTTRLPSDDDATRFARDALNKTVSRIARRVETRRSSTVATRSEERTRSVIDNSAGAANLCAVYRWVDEVFEAWVVNYGNRLLMEFMVPQPARWPGGVPGWPGGVPGGPGADGERVPSPARLGIHSFEDIRRRNYARLCAAYGVTDIAPPPLRRKFVSAAVRSNDSAPVAVPSGYRAHAARAACVSNPVGPFPDVLVGNAAVPPDGTPVPLPPYGEETSLPVSVADVAGLRASPPWREVTVNVEIECLPTRRCVDEWRIAIYAALTEAYRKGVERRRAVLAEPGVGPAGLSPLACRDIERRALKRGCQKLLLERAAAIAGRDGRRSPPAAEVDLPRLTQFLDQALEWPEMSYSFLPGDRDLDGAGADGPDARGDALFADFLLAPNARVLLPVRPDRVLALLYFWSSGLVWDGQDDLVAVNAADVHIVDDLKRVARDGLPERRIGAPWEVTVPTAMQVLDGSDLAPLGRDVVVAGPAA